MASPSPKGRLAVLSWGGAGFLVGAVFWHFIGFWSFVSDVVLKGRSDDVRLVAQTGRDCSEAFLDRDTGAVTLLACPPRAPELAEGFRAIREDSERLLRQKRASPARWTVQVSQDEDDRVADGR